MKDGDKVSRYANGINERNENSATAYYLLNRKGLQKAAVLLASQ